MNKNELNNFMLTNNNYYYVEYKGVGYILQDDLLKKFYNQTGIDEGIPVSDDTKNYIIEKCLEDLPF